MATLKIIQPECNTKLLKSYALIQNDPYIKDFSPKTWLTLPGNMGITIAKLRFSLEGGYSKTTECPLCKDDIKINKHLFDCDQLPPKIEVIVR